MSESVETTECTNDTDVDIEVGETTVTGRTAIKVTNIVGTAALAMLVAANPKRPGSAASARFENYFKDGVNTVEKAITAGVTMGDIKFDIAHKFIAVDGAIIEEYTVNARGPRGPKAPGGKSNDPDLNSGEDLLTEGANPFDGGESDILG